MSLPIPTTTIKPRSWFFLVVLLLIMATYQFALRSVEPNEARYILLLPALLVIIIWFLFQRTSITFGNEGIMYKTVFATRTFQWEDVTRTYLRFKHRGKSGNMQWRFDLFEKRHHISISFYRRKELQLLAEAVVEKCRQAEIDPRITGMATGKFPWYIF